MFNVAIMMIVMGIGLLIICEHDKSNEIMSFKIRSIGNKKLLVLLFFLYFKGGPYYDYKGYA